MTLLSRPYQHPHDFAHLTSFLSRARSAIHHAHYLHSGDQTWQLFHMLASYPPADLIQIWQDSPEQILGFVLLYPTFGFFDLQLDPHHRGSQLEAEMLQWAEEHLAPTEHLYTLANNRDMPRLTLLTAHGYEPNGEWLYLERRLNDVLPDRPLPPGFILRSLDGEQEAAARTAVLGAAFGAPSQPERYLQFMNAPGYVRDLDLVVVAPNGRFAAFAMCWVDPTSKVGQFEPIGTAPEFRRQGLAQALLSEGLRRMQQYGAERAIVIVEAAEEAARQVYGSVGFEYQWSLTLYMKSQPMG